MQIEIPLRGKVARSQVSPVIRKFRDLTSRVLFKDPSLTQLERSSLARQVFSSADSEKTRNFRVRRDDGDVKSQTTLRRLQPKRKYLRYLTCAVWAKSRLISVCATVHQTPCICMHMRHEVNGTLENNRALAARRAYVLHVCAHARGVSTRARVRVCTGNVRRSRRPEWERYRFRIPFCLSRSSAALCEKAHWASRNPISS